MRGGEGKGDGKETDREEKKSSVRERGGFGFSPCAGRELIGGVGNGEKEDEKNAFVFEPGGVATEREDAKTLAVFVLEAAGARLRFERGGAAVGGSGGEEEGVANSCLDSGGESNILRTRPADLGDGERRGVYETNGTRNR
ncbi:uncharacterized protein STEHIDRAFT_114357 [Stereum hirsutum FP-91666 SS1]|uniref:uncharacterized protein n=1 Tax=Stereum hirsutum (strain FP-91666) TaxID=721885 RepID=UPI0004449F1F|nr:uncharacterized protein STEHIDRAFT_114357 [Stereum hirsutum FP-91666 SS1]EIM82445.1 hypothetical protein STEHIDRAFT_114357 [Stereum hirsutum FP-91666 SS1]